MADGGWRSAEGGGQSAEGRWRSAEGGRQRAKMPTAISEAAISEAANGAALTPPPLDRDAALRVVPRVLEQPLFLSSRRFPSRRGRRSSRVVRRVSRTCSEASCRSV